MLSVAAPLSGHASCLECDRGCIRRLIRPSPPCSRLQEVEKPVVRRSPATELPAIREAKRVVLVRHGQSTWNAEGRIQGSSDFSVLTSKGESQAETSRQMLLADSFDVCFISPLVRSRRTAEIIWGARNGDMISISDLREIDLYSFQGLLKHEGKAKYGNAYLQWQKNAPNFFIDGHYPVRDLWGRAKTCWEEILIHRGKSVLIVAHNAVNQALVATAIGLGTEYFRVLLQSNCGVSVLDFTPQSEGGPPIICLDRLNQTPNSPVSAGSSGGRKTSKRIILVCHGTTQSDTEGISSNAGYEPMNMLGVIQSQKTAEVLLDLKVNCIISSPRIASVDTATAIAKVQEAADCLGAHCMPRYVEIKKLLELEVEPLLQHPQLTIWFGGVDNDNGVLMKLWNQSKKAWQLILKEFEVEEEDERSLVVVGNSTILVALICHCLNLPADWIGSFRIDAGGITVLDFPDGPSARGVARCINYTAHLGRWSIPVTRPSTDEEEF